MKLELHQKKLIFYLIRYFFVIYLINRGVDLCLFKKMLGNFDIKYKEIYIQVRKERLFGLIKMYICLIKIFKI
jgi:Site-specific recombinase XerD